MTPRSMNRLVARIDPGATVEGLGGARSPSPVGSDRHRHGDIVMYDPQAPQSMTQFNQHVANVHLDPSMTVNQEVTNYQQINATQNNAQFNQFVNQDTGPMVPIGGGKTRRNHCWISKPIGGHETRDQKNAEQRANTMKSEREAEVNYRSAMNTISEQEKQIRELRAMMEQMMQNQQQQPAQPDPAPASRSASASDSIGHASNSLGRISSQTFECFLTQLEEGRERPLRQRRIRSRRGG